MTPTDTRAGDAKLSAHDQALLQRRSRVLGPAYRLFYDRPLHVVRGEGVWLWDSDGRRYLDAYNNVASLGHGHPAVFAAVSRQGLVHDGGGRDRARRHVPGPRDRPHPARALGGRRGSWRIREVATHQYRG